MKAILTTSGLRSRGGFSEFVEQERAERDKPVLEAFKELEKVQRKAAKLDQRVWQRELLDGPLPDLFTELQYDIALGYESDVMKEQAIEDFLTLRPEMRNLSEEDWKKAFHFLELQQPPMQLNLKNLDFAVAVLIEYKLIQEPVVEQPTVEPEKQEDPEITQMRLETEQRNEERRYNEEIVAYDKNRKGYTQRQIDEAPSALYKELAGVKIRKGWVSPLEDRY